MEEFLWVEKYRPKTVKDVILPDRFREHFAGYVAQGDIPNLILSGSPGVGKTTIAKAMLDELGVDYIIVNGSLDGTKDTLRNEIRDFATSRSHNGKRKYVILDEADYLTQQMQPALRNFMESYSSNCGFILTCNYKFRILPELHSRCSLIEFNFTKQEKGVLLEQIYTRVGEILDKEGVRYSKKVVLEVVVKTFPDIRKSLNELQKYTNQAGEINTGALAEFDIKEVVDLIKTKNFEKIRSWVAETEYDDNEIFTILYDKCHKYFTPGGSAQLVLILADYQHRAPAVANRDINLAAAILEIAVNCELK